jgi:hypothetical protein
MRGLVTRNRRVAAALEAAGAIVVVSIVLSIPLFLRARNIHTLEAEYGSLRIGAPIATTQASKLEFVSGPPPARYQNYVWWRSEGDRQRCAEYAVRHGGFLAVNFAYVVGRDSHGRVAFKCIGNT